MPAPVDPFASLPRRQRWLLRWRLKRAWRLGRYEQRALTLAAVRDTALGVPLQEVHNDSANLVTLSELTFPDGTALRLGFCYTPAVQKLAAALAYGPVVLDRMAYHGRCWGLYFQTESGRLPVLAATARLAPGEGGGRIRPSQLTPV